MAKKRGVILLILITMIIAYELIAGVITNMNRYEWLPTESSYEKYPMSIIKGDLIFDDGTSIYIPSSKTIDNGWGELGSTHVVGKKLKPLPVKIEISWFSYTENKFYSGAFSLPYEKISKLFREGLHSPITGEKITYQNIIVGVAPAGAISIWLMADGEVLLVANFRAREENIDWKKFTEDDEIHRSVYISETLKNHLSKENFSDLAQNGIPYAKLEAHGKQFSWNTLVTGAKPTHLWLKTFNGECEFIDLVKGGPSRRNLRAVPKHIDIDWQDRYGTTFTGDITFNEDEVLKAYQKLSNGKTDHELKLDIEINEKNPGIVMSLKDSRYIYHFEKAVSKAYLK
jgi:hypothetical protein